MHQTVEFTSSDEGKRVTAADGDTIGRVIEVRHGSAYVDPDPDLLDTVKSKLGWGDIDEETYPLKSAEVASVTDDEIQLRRL